MLLSHFTFFAELLLLTVNPTFLCDVKEYMRLSWLTLSWWCEFCSRYDCKCSVASEKASTQNCSTLAESTTKVWTRLSHRAPFLEGGTCSRQLNGADAYAYIQYKTNVKQSNTKMTVIKLVLWLQVLKLYAWELSFQDKVNAVRLQELNTIKRLAFLSSVSTFFWTTAPVLVIYWTFPKKVFLGLLWTLYVSFIFCC